MEGFDAAAAKAAFPYMPNTAVVDRVNLCSKRLGVLRRCRNKRRKGSDRCARHQPSADLQALFDQAVREALAFWKTAPAEDDVLDWEPSWRDGETCESYFDEGTIPFRMARSIKARIEMTLSLSLHATNPLPRPPSELLVGALQRTATRYGLSDAEVHRLEAEEGTSLKEDRER